MIIARIALAIAILAVISVTPTYARDKCDDKKGKEQVDCLADEVVYTIWTMCEKNVECSTEGMLAVLKYAKGWKYNKRK